MHPRTQSEVSLDELELWTLEDAEAWKEAELFWDSDVLSDEDQLLDSDLWMDADGTGSLSLESLSRLGIRLH